MFRIDEKIFSLQIRQGVYNPSLHCNLSGCSPRKKGVIWNLLPSHNSLSPSPFIAIQKLRRNSMAVQDEVPKSRLTITYKTEVNGEPAVVNLPLRLMVLGDFSNGSSKDRKLDLEERKLRSLDGRNTNEMMKDMGISMDVVVPNKINPQEEGMRVKVNFDSMSSFSPEEVAKQVPQIRSLLLLKKLLEEIQSNIANKKEFASLVNNLFANKELLSKYREKLKDYEMYRIPDKKTEEAPK